jgi:hypothetical protein
VQAPDGVLVEVVESVPIPEAESQERPAPQQTP